MVPKPLRLGSSLSSTWPLQTAEPASPSLLAPSSPATPRFAPHWNASPQPNMSRFVVPTAQARPSSQAASLLLASETSTPTSFHEATSGPGSLLSRDGQPLLRSTYSFARSSLRPSSSSASASDRQDVSEAVKPSHALRPLSPDGTAGAQPKALNSIHGSDRAASSNALRDQHLARFSAYTAGCIEDLETLDDGAVVRYIDGPLDSAGDATSARTSLLDITRTPTAFTAASSVETFPFRPNPPVPSANALASGPSPTSSVLGRWWPFSRRRKASVKQACCEPVPADKGVLRPPRGTVASNWTVIESGGPSAEYPAHLSFEHGRTFEVVTAPHPRLLPPKRILKLSTTRLNEAEPDLPQPLSTDGRTVHFTQSSPSASGFGVAL